MRINFLACILFHIYLGSVLAQDENSLSGVKGLPGCAVSRFCARSSPVISRTFGVYQTDMSCQMICLFSNVSHSTCQLTDLKCSCSNVPLRKILEKCVLQTCTVKESLTTKKITAKLCEVPVRERSTRLRDLNIGLAVLSHLSVFSRMGSKLAGYKAAYSFGLDDVCLLVTTYIGLGNAIIINHGAIPSGLGRDIWTLSMAAITNFIHWFYFMEILYFVQLAILKVGILFFYKRIFPGKEVKRLIWGTIAFNIAFGVAFALAGIFQCQPVSRYWTHWDGVARGGKCVDINALAWTNASISIVVDIWMLGIPLFQVAKLQMAVKEKIAVSLMFAVGFLYVYPHVPFEIVEADVLQCHHRFHPAITCDHLLHRLEEPDLGPVGRDAFVCDRAQRRQRLCMYAYVPHSACWRAPETFRLDIRVITSTPSGQQNAESSRIYQK